MAGAIDGTGTGMRFNRADHSDDLGRLRGDRRAAVRAIGDNYLFGENVGPDRLADFEAFPATAIGLRPIAAEYFRFSVQGTQRDHRPSTFPDINGSALMPAGVEPAQKIVRVERLDSVLNRGGGATPAQVQDDFDRLRAAVEARPADLSVIDPVIRNLNAWPGARPMFACFKAEVAADLAAPDWLPRLRARLGLGHHALADGETGHFALMQYTAEEVFRQAGLPRPFAVPTVLESQNSEFFFPAPAGQGVGYAVDLDSAAGRDWIREILHIRLTYSADHLVRVTQLAGPTPRGGLAAARDAHLGRVRAKCARPDYGAPMSGEVDD